MSEFDRLIGASKDPLDRQKKRPVIAIADADHEDTLKCLQTIAERRIADALLIGRIDRIERRAEELGIDLSGFRLLDAADEQKACLLAVESVVSGEAQVLMKGGVHTSTFSKAVFDKSAGLLGPGALVSHLGLFEFSGYQKPLFVTDGAINIAPDLEKKAQILSNAISSIKAMGIARPKVAILAPVETVSPKIGSTVDARDLVAMHRETDRFPDCMIEGPYALDVILSKRAAAIKGIESEVAGEADLVLCPDLDTGNAVFKLLTLYPESRGAGMLVGLSVPVVLTSRSDSPRTRVDSVCMAISSVHS